MTTTDMTYPHRTNRDGSIDSICPNCFQTISSRSQESDLADDEKAHVCEVGSLNDRGNPAK